MEYKRYSLEMECTGFSRKKAAEIISKALKNDASYDSTENKYTVKDSIGRDWTIEKPRDDIVCQRIENGRLMGANFLFAIKLSTPLLNYRDLDTLETVISQLQQSGAIVNQSTNAAIFVEANNCSERYQKNIDNIFKSKGQILEKVLQCQTEEKYDCSHLSDQHLIKFSMFQSSLSPKTIHSYIQLSCCIQQQAQNRMRIYPTQKETPNEKYAFRTWLLRLGMIGSEFKDTRQLLLENLEGNSAWKNPETANSHRHSAEETVDVNPIETQEINGQDELNMKM